MANCRNCGTEIEQYLYDRYEGLCFSCFDQMRGKSARKINVKAIMIGMEIVGLIILIFGIYFMVIGVKESEDSPLFALGLTLTVIGLGLIITPIGYATNFWCPSCCDCC